MFSMILISHLNFTTKRERIPYILAFFESCLLEYLKSQVDVDKSTETQGTSILTRQVLSITMKLNFI